MSRFGEGILVVKFSTRFEHFGKMFKNSTEVA